MAEALEFDPDSWRENPIFTEYSDEDPYTDTFLQAMWNNSVLYISDSDYGCINGDKRVFAIELMMAHLIYIQEKIENGESLTVMTSAAEGSVSVGLSPPPSNDGWSWWLSASSYGQMLYSILASCAVGGFVVGGRPERSAFRKAYGRF